MRYDPEMSGSPEIDDDAPVPAKLRFAIAHKRLIGVGYKGRLRIAEPHDFGALNGTAKRLVYQLHVAGAAAGQPAQGWRLFDVAKIGVCKVLEQTFPGSRGAAHEQHMRWDAVFARVE
jgi:hypothetical protein